MHQQTRDFETRRKTRTEDPRFSMPSFEAHFDGSDSFFDAFSVVCETGNLHLEMEDEEMNRIG